MDKDAPHLKVPEIRKWTQYELVSRRVLIGNVIAMAVVVQFDRIPRWCKLATIGAILPAFAMHEYATERLERLVDRFYMK